LVKDDSPYHRKLLTLCTVNKQTTLRNIRLRTHAVPVVIEIMFQNDILIICLKRVVTKRLVLYLEPLPPKKVYTLYIVIYDCLPTVIEFPHLMRCVL